MMPSAKGKRPLRHMSACEKINAIQRIHDGESKASVARDIGVPESTLRGWCKNEEKLRFMSTSAGSDNKLSVDKVAEQMSEESTSVAAGLYSEKRIKLDNYLSNGKSKYDDLSFKNRASLGSIGFSNSVGINFNDLNQCKYNVFKASDLAQNGRIKCEGNMHRGYGADVKQSDPTKSDISMSAISPLSNLTQLSGMPNTSQNYNLNELALNYNFLSQINSHSSLATVSALTNPQNNGLRTVRPKQPSQSLNVKNQSKLHKSPAVDNIGMGGDMIDKPKKPSPASLSRDVPADAALRLWIKKQQELNFQNCYPPSSSVSPSHSSPLQQQKLLPTATSITPPLSSAPQASTSTSTLEELRSIIFWQLCKYNSEIINGSSNINRALIENMLQSQQTNFNDTRVCSTSPIYNNDNVNNNTNNANTPEDLSKPSVRSSPLMNQATKIELRDPTASTSPLPDQQVKSEVLCNNNNNIGHNELNDSKLCQPSKAIEHAEHFLSWLEEFSDPTITTADYRGFRNLLEKIKKIDERVKNPVPVPSSKIRRRK